MALKKATKPAAPTHLTSAPAGQGTRPSTLRFEHRRHMYFDGRRWLPSVTGIAERGGEKKDALLGWHADTTATCAIEEAAELSRLRRLDGDDAAYEWLRKAPDRKRDKATVKGSDLHDVADRMLSGMDMPEYLHPDIEDMAKQVLAFMADYRVEVLYSEVRLAHRTCGYGGTTDQIGIVPQYGDLPVIIDWKTSESMFRNPKFHHGKNAMQLAPYSRAEVMFWDDRTEADMIPVNQDLGLIVMIRPEGYKVYDYDLVRGWEQFERAFASYHWWRDVDELARGPVRPVAAPVVEPCAGCGEVGHVLDECECPHLQCERCDHDRHRCPGCGDGLPHRGPGVCADCADVDGPGSDGHHIITGECFACMVGVATGPESHGARCSLRAEDPLLTAIREVLDPETFDELWEANATTWTDAHTAAVRKRLAELGVS